MSSKFNAADRPTRLDSKIKDFVIGTEWQEGPSYMRLPFTDWPWERNFADRKLSDLVPQEELISKFRGISSSLKNLDDSVFIETNSFLFKLRFGYITNYYDRLLILIEQLFRWLAKYRASGQASLIALSSRNYAVRFWFKFSMQST